MNFLSRCRFPFVGYRNFKNINVALNEKVLLIGPNDIGKSNFLRAIRLLLDKNLSESEIEPKDADFYAFEETNEFTITLFFEGVTEDCIKSKFKENMAKLQKSCQDVDMTGLLLI